MAVEQAVARLKSRRELEGHASAGCPLRFGVRIDFKGAIQQIAIFGVQIASAQGHFLAVRGKLELVEEVDHTTAVDEEVEVCTVLEREYIFLLGLEVERGGDHAL